jgi:hypothetical protein
LVTLVPVIRNFAISAWGKPPGGNIVWDGDHEKAVLFRAPSDIRPRITKSNPTLSEAVGSSGLAGKKPVIPILHRYAERVIEIIRMFDK